MEHDNLVTKGNYSYHDNSFSELGRHIPDAKRKRLVFLSLKGDNFSVVTEGTVTPTVQGKCMA
jgi:hypothetical protein